MADVDEAIAERPEPSEKSVRLTEDLLYIVNKKLKAMDKTRRNRRLEKLETDNQYVPIKKVTYRTQRFDSSQTQLAVMHKHYFFLNTVAV